MNRTFKLATFSLAALTGFAFAEEEITVTDEVIVTATRSRKNPFEIPYATAVIRRQALKNERMTRSFPELLKDEGISVQKTANGQGSPFIRGFTGFRTLLMVDGVRLNNSTFRPGPNQYWATVDPLSFQSIEVVKGPTSVLHGSDAVGGAVNALTLSPYNGDKAFTGSLYTRLASGENSNTQRVEVSGRLLEGSDYLLAYTRRDFGDVDAGGGSKDGSGHQHTTGYEEPGNYDFKLITQIDSDSQMTLLHQHVFQDDVWRTHRTVFGKSWHGTTVGSDISRIFDQSRDLTYLRYENTDFKVTLSHHLQEEERRRARSNLRFEIQGTRVQTWGLQTQINKKFDQHEITTGFDYYHDNVDSYFSDFNNDGSLRTLRPRGPVADNSSYGLLGVFLQDEIQHDKWSFIPGIRYTFVDVDADKVDENPSDATPYGRVSKTFETVTGSLRVLHKTTSKVRTYLGLSQGFRAPNLSDYTRFDEARTNEIQTPTQSLDPEEFWVGEVGARFKNKSLFVEAAYYYTLIDDYIIRKPTGAVVNGSQEVKAANSGEGFVEGAEFKLKLYLSDTMTFSGDYNWNRGQVDDFSSSDLSSKDERPISKMGANNGAIGLRYDALSEKWWLETTGRFTRRQDKLAVGDVSDTSRIPPVDGTPGYNIYNLRGGYFFSDDLQINAAIENITDKAYRVHGSGQNEVGRNFIFSVDLKF
jgi:hemoglobin/transferrin/lactoferrin receptor protein